MGHCSIQVTVDIYYHYVPGGSNKQASIDWMRFSIWSKRRSTPQLSATTLQTLKWESSGFHRKWWELLEPATRIERATCGLRNRCSTN